MTLKFFDGTTTLRDTDGEFKECEYELYTTGNTPYISIIKDGERISIDFKDWSQFKGLVDGMNDIVARLDDVNK